MQVNPYLHFNGQCEAAFKFYETVLDGKINDMRRYGSAPMDVPEDSKNKIMHASMKIGDTVLMGSDSPPGHFEKVSGMTVALILTDPNKAETVFAALADGGEIHMPIDKTFWSRKFGMLKDRFGIPWMINCE